MFYPIMLDIVDKEIVIIGGGKVGYRKARNFLEFKGKVTVISENFLEKFCELKNKNKESLTLVKDTYKKEYIYNSFLVVAATSVESINKQISKDCNDEGILCNVVDSLEDSEFICTSIVNRGDLVLSISTMGKCPFLSKKIRLDLEKQYSKIDEEYIILLGEIRNIIISKYSHRKKELLDYCLKLSKEELKTFYQELKGDKNI
ncbi:precorrin-2 dehydrogenase/sirohydrochlorin ferrochelatase family protein [Anaerosalibacter massiliensis]|uniref:precorrin-2 dehydrogenase n=1 Tax=Anaerosalibacter massiliensis TaxID=1347392 RepID=A0A9X2S4V9_9FIRM|nr:bifunctional precorrin-2 dehydrogenase/sirohydrochlorin ferrochelatase [Anaerosalibacter massiliensis]MCR2043694.1 bifunctional precorrin-2 dehydrogenase/sirohydrochlorin ferrochelatase [Anaerosalibacter massiliensis]